MTAESNDGNAHTVRMYSDISGGEYLFIFQLQIRTLTSLLLRIFTWCTRCYCLMAVQRWRNQYHPFRTICSASTIQWVWGPCFRCRGVLLLQESKCQNYSAHSIDLPVSPIRSAEPRRPGRFRLTSSTATQQRTWKLLWATQLIQGKDYYQSKPSYPLLRTF